jgi:hypothetical protein
MTGADAWKLVEAKADARSAWVTMKLDFFRIPRYMKAVSLRAHAG